VKTLRIDDVEGIPVLGTLMWKPIRKPFGVTAFGINAYVAENAGDEVVEEHTETQLGHEEIYAVIRGHAVFTVDGEEVDAPWGTLVYLDDPKQKRHAVAKEAGTTVLAIGGVPGVHEPSAWEYFFPALPAHRAEDWPTARRILEEALQEKDHSAIRYALACVEARDGNPEKSLEWLATCDERHRHHAPRDDDFASVRDDPRFAELTAS
jgi:hypothetical protein